MVVLELKCLAIIVILLLATGEEGAGTCLESLGPLVIGAWPPSRSPVREISLVRCQLLEIVPPSCSARAVVPLPGRFCRGHDSAVG